MKILKKFASDKKGATAIEYGLIAALIAIAMITAVTTVGGNLSKKFNSIGSELEKAPVKPL